MRIRLRRQRHDECAETQELLSDHLEGELRGPVRLRVARHLARCPECGRVFRSLVRAVEGLRSLGRSLPH